MNRIAAALIGTSLFAHSVFGQAAAADREAPLMRDFMGINAHTVQFDAPLYAPLCDLVRDYHLFDWDINDDTSLDATFPLARKHIKWKDPSGAFPAVCRAGELARAVRGLEAGGLRDRRLHHLRAVQARAVAQPR